VSLPVKVAPSNETTSALKSTSSDEAFWPKTARQTTHACR
jgi:hypothetical protein